jgi:hypothetical protein
MQCGRAMDRFAVWDQNFALRSARGYAIERTLHPTMQRHCPNE